MKVQKSPPELVERFKRLAPTEPDVEHRLMFGYPSCVINGHLFTGLFEDSLTVRLGPTEREEVLKTEGARTFEPMPGRPMKEYVALTPAIVDDETLSGWMEKAAEYARTLPPKEKKTAKKPR
jgi:hypothetical protein